MGVQLGHSRMKKRQFVQKFKEGHYIVQKAEVTHHYYFKIEWNTKRPPITIIS